MALALYLIDEVPFPFSDFAISSSAMSQLIAFTEQELLALSTVISHLYRKGDVSTLIHRKDTREAFTKIIKAKDGKCPRLRKRRR